MPKLAQLELSKVLDVSLEHISRKKELVFIKDKANTQYIHRLACTHDIYEVITTCPKKSTPTIEQKFNDASYKVIFLNSSKKYSKETTRAIYKACFQSMTTPKVEMKNPQAIFAIYADSTNIYIAKRVFHNKEEFLIRHAHKRPKLHPSAMKPRFARAMINLAGVKHGTIYDPFCGTGGFLIEGLHMGGLHMIGSDISEKMLTSAKINIEHEKIRNATYQLTQQSATTTDIKADAIVTDVPYGKNTKNITNSLYKEFLHHIKKEKNAHIFVICFPSFANAKTLIKKCGFTITFSTRYYIHGSLTREILVFK